MLSGGLPTWKSSSEHDQGGWPPLTGPLEAAALKNARLVHVGISGAEGVG